MAKITLGKKLMALRYGETLTQDQLAEKLGVSRTTVNSWENDKGRPSLERMKQLADLFQIDIKQLTNLL